METKTKTTTRMGLQEPTDTSLICRNSAEPFNAMGSSNTNHSENPKSHFHVRREYNSSNSSVRREVCNFHEKLNFKNDTFELGRYLPKFGVRPRL